MSWDIAAHGPVDPGPTPLFAADHLTLDDIQVEHILGGADRGTVPAGYDALVEILAATRQSVTTDELDGETEAVALFRTQLSPRATAGRSSRVRRRRRAIAFFGTGALTVGVLTGSAAAAGMLPGPEQAVAAAILAKFGIDVPDGQPHRPDGYRAIPGTHPGKVVDRSVEAWLGGVITEPTPTLAPVAAGSRTEERGPLTALPAGPSDQLQPEHPLVPTPDPPAGSPPKNPPPDAPAEPLPKNPPAGPPAEPLPKNPPAGPPAEPPPMNPSGPPPMNPPGPPLEHRPDPPGRPGAPLGSPPVTPPGPAGSPPGPPPVSQDGPPPTPTGHAAPPPVGDPGSSPSPPAVRPPRPDGGPPHPAG